MITKVIYVLNVLKSSKYIIILTIAYYNKNRMISNTLIRVPIKHTQNTVNFCSTITSPWFLECYFATLHLNLFNFNKIHPTFFLIQRNLSTICVVVSNFCSNSIFSTSWVFTINLRLRCKNKKQVKETHKVLKYYFVIYIEHR